MKEVQMNDEQMTINQGLIFDGMVFASMRDRNRYASTETKLKPQWLQQSPGKWIRLNDIVQPAPPPAERQTSSHANATPLSPSELAKNEIAIGGHLYVSAKYLAGKMGMSERSLKRRCANGKGPPHVKIAGVYYDRGMARQWAKGKGLSRSRRTT
jgi:hypothetical protein